MCRHHKQKIALVFAGMRGLAERLRKRKVRVRYVGYEDDGQFGLAASARCAARWLTATIDEVVVTAPGEHTGLWKRSRPSRRNRMCRSSHPRGRSLPLRPARDFAAWADGKKELRMEFFYREMRRRYAILMDDEKPVGGAWNLDKQNRKAMPKRLTPPASPFRGAERHRPARAIEDIARLFPDNFGSLDGFGYATTPDEAEAIVADFIDNILAGLRRLPGRHGRGRAVDVAFHHLCGDEPRVDRPARRLPSRRGRLPCRPRALFNAVEGFIRQIIGWREYMRGIYWLKMPAFKATQRFEGANRKLPWMYWSGETEMNCVREAVQMTARARLRPSHPAPDGDRQSGDAARRATPTRSTIGTWSSTPTPTNGSNCRTRTAWRPLPTAASSARSPTRPRVPTSTG